MAKVPVVNLRDFTHGSAAERERFIQAFGDGLQGLGPVAVEGHQVPIDLTHRVFELAAQFFALPDESKRRYIVEGGGGERGYTAFGQERAVGARTNDLKEFWHVGQERSSEAGPQNLWPRELPTFRHTVLAIYRALEECALDLLRALAAYLRLPEPYFADMARGGESILRIAHYPPVRDAPENAVRAAEHANINLLTLRCEASTGGLEVHARDGQWLPIRSQEGQIVCDAGDMLAVVTNGVISSTTHRVTNPPQGENKSRYSMPFFVHPRPDVLLAPAPTTVGPEGPKFAPILAHDFLTERLKQIGLLGV